MGFNAGSGFSTGHSSVLAFTNTLGMDIVQHGEEAYATGEGAILITPEAGLGAEMTIADPI